MSTDTVTPLLDAGLGNNAYLVDLGDGRGMVVDASRDLRAVRRAADRHGLRIGFAADTHLHADFLSGARQLAATDGAKILASAAGRRAFEHTGLSDGDQVDLGGLRLEVIGTPGHTEEHIAFLLLDGDVPLGVFTGGSLIVGSAARTDLVDPTLTEKLARAQYHSLQRLMALPDEVQVWPTHGAGSFCSSPAGAKRTSTIGDERAANRLLAAEDEDTFVDLLVGSLGTYPSYFRRLAELNRRGPNLLPPNPSLAQLTADEVRDLLARGAHVVDVRPVEEFAAGHVPGALSIALRDAFASWLGWVEHEHHPLVIVRGADQDPDEILWQAAKIGFENLVGELSGGIAAWTAAGLPADSVSMVHVDDAPHSSVLDVRQTAEFQDGHLPGAHHIELGSLPARIGQAPQDDTLIMCGHGERAMTAASLMKRAGRHDIAVLTGEGVPGWAHAHHVPLETGR